ncbi:hypothetical protein SAMN05720473_10846 [Fibrobacter sp. UWB15]|uniref:hypothetical protein n=1 Tax=unclassified Fibrobacter TaxID=2634177 RepID=UPI000920C574|nr:MULTISPECIES: hypothetical protein [unclassified Fibrobacter]PWJ63455.1 hypothetical protein BGW99_10846 [Fibrobacter sp. UWB6]SHG31853.1 hypothetical protein SAMN05720760_10877 [Fibrobacter sp. UWB8]SMG36049.1 hypothetical protein SAMN05720473_10846 [Fibrobacter sp. UWB15]
MTSVNKISDFKLERYLLGELSEKEMRELQERELSDEIFAARVAEMRLQGKRFVAENPFVALDAKMAAAEQSANDEHNVVSVRWLKVAAALVIALGVFSMVVLNRDDATYDRDSASMQVAMADVDDGTRIKGMQASLEVWKKTGDSAVQMVNLGDAHEGDEIQLRYRVPQKCFGMLFSMDGNGTITMHMGEGNKAIELEPGKMTTLPFAYKLDNAPKFEKFFLLTSQNSFEIDGNDIDKSLKQTGVENVSFTLRKVGK